MQRSLEALAQAVQDGDDGKNVDLDEARDVPCGSWLAAGSPRHCRPQEG